MNDWEQRYQAGETGWDRAACSPALAQWLENGLSPCRIMIPGCGRGYEVVELARRGFAVTAIDIAPSAIAHLQAALHAADVTAEIISGDLFDYKPDVPFDAIYEQTCLCAIRPNQRGAYEARLFEWLNPGGRLYALFMQTGAEGGPPFHCDLLAMRKLFDASHWQWSEHLPLFVPQRSGRFELGYQLIRQ